MANFHPFEQKLASSWPPGDWQDVTVLAAVSGGADSMALLRALATLKTGGEGRLVIAHANHQLRGEESAADEALVVAACRKLDLPCDVGRIEVGGTQKGGEGLESAARRARYAYLEQTAAQIGARYVVTAHTADDQVETILHRVLRGTGVRGLAGMSRARPLGAATLIRPMLSFRRAEILGYLDDRAQLYRQDSSNQDMSFTRNRIRRELLPLLAEQYNSAAVDALLRLGALAREAQEVIDRAVDELSALCIRESSEETVVLDTAALPDSPRYVVRELLTRIWREHHWPLQDMGFREWDLLADMAMLPASGDAARGRRRTLPGHVRAERHAGELRFTRAKQEERRCG